MCQQHAKSDVATARIGLATIVHHEFGDDADDRSFEFEEPALVEEHRHRCGGDGFCDRGYVEKRCRLDVNVATLRLARGRLLSQRTRQGWGALRSGLSWRAHFIREVAKCLECDYAIPVGD